MEDGQKIGYRELIQTCHPAITRVFDFQIIEGERDCLKDPEKVILPEVWLSKCLVNSPL